MQDNRTLYEKNVQDRSQLHYLIGLMIRWKQNFKYARARKLHASVELLSVKVLLCL